MKFLGLVANRILVLFLLLTPFFGRSQSDYFGNVSMDILWAEENEQWGMSFGSSFNLKKDKHPFPLFLGFNLGVNEAIGLPNISQSEVNSFGREHMSGNSLSNAELQEGFNEMGFGGGLNLIQYFFMKSKEVPYLGIGAKFYRFPQNQTEVKIISENTQYEFTDYEYMPVSDAFYNYSLEGHIHFGITHAAAYFGVFPGNEVRSNFYYFGMSYVMASKISF